jgi:hypothetical protein
MSFICISIEARAIAFDVPAFEFFFRFYSSGVRAALIDRYARAYCDAKRGRRIGGARPSGERIDEIIAVAS